MKLGRSLAVVALLGVGACTISTYTDYGETYDPYLTARVFERYMQDAERQKARAMTFALSDRRDELGVPYSDRFFRDMGFACSANVCALTVRKYVFRLARSNIPQVPRPPEFGDAAALIVDEYVVAYTPQSIDVDVTSRTTTYTAP